MLLAATQRINEKIPHLLSGRFNDNVRSLCDLYIAG